MSRIRSDELYSLIFYRYLLFPRNEEEKKKKWRKKKKRGSVDKYKGEPEKGKRLLKKYRRPRTDRMLPTHG